LTYDLVIVGAGPAGLAAAINGSSEGLKVALLDRSMELGGQARESACIENYPLPFSDYRGVTGSEMMAGFSAQAERFGATIVAPVSASRLVVQPSAPHEVVTDDLQTFRGRAVLLSMGLAYRRLTIPGLMRFMGRQVFYGCPPRVTGKRVAVIGGANSAGQAVVRLAKECNHVYLLSRSPIEKGMSQYLASRIRNFPNVTVVEGVTPAEAEGDRELAGIGWSIGDDVGYADIDHLFIFIGAVPHTGWLHGAVLLCPKGFIPTGSDLPKDQRVSSSPCSTNVPGIFAAGDVRLGQGVKRITGAVFDGVCSVQGVHQYLAT